MSDLIKREHALRCAEHDSETYYALSCLPKVDAESVRHGRWVEYPECLKYENAYGDIDIVCSCCEAVFNVMDNDTDRFDYCPHCGAKMDERTEE